MTPAFTHRYPRVLTIAGSDSGGGAGIQADLKTFAALGCFGTSAITALTAQNTLGVRAIHAVPSDFLRAQIAAVVDDIGVDAVKVGMLHAADVVRAVAEAIDAHRLAPVVVDPVMVATSGARLLADEAVQALIEELFPRAALVTPNLDEAGFLTGRRLVCEADMEAAADLMLVRGAPAVLLKGGHLPGATVSDLFAARDGRRVWLCAPRIATANTHGTGCTLSAAIAARLALGDTLDAAVGAGTSFVRRALAAGAAVRTGGGSGPLNHGAAPETMRLLPL